jgi:uncharacterized protein YbjQ (UPF0145 family)
MPVCSKCNKEKNLMFTETFYELDNGEFLCLACYKEHQKAERKEEEERKKKKEETYKLEHTCSSCEEIKQEVIRKDDKLFCHDCFCKTISCATCGNNPKSYFSFQKTYKYFLNQYFCSTCFIEFFNTKVQITTTNSLEGYKIVEYLGFESVEIVIGTGWFSEFTGEISDRFGLRSTEFEKKLKQAKEVSEFLLKKKAYEKGANAIVGVDLDYTEFSGNRVGLIMNGTLVKIEKLPKNS